MSTLLLLTESFPLGGISERAFIEPELRALARAFGRVILVPAVDRGEPLPLPPGCEVNRAVVSSPFMRCKWLRPLLSPALSFRWLAESPSYSLAAAAVAQALRPLLRELRGPVLGYSFWFDFGASALALAGIPFVSRAHGHDIRMTKAPRLRQYTLSRSLGLYAASACGAGELSRRFPDCSSRISFAHLGVPLPRQEALPPSGGKTLRFLSCSRAVPLKRVGLTIRLLRALAVARPGWQIHLTHIGGDPSDTAPLSRLAAAEDPVFGVQRNFTATFTGTLPHDRVVDAMATGKFDWFIHTSAAEGGVPIALLEAMSLAIPPVATDAGGVSEVLTDECGILLPLNPEPEEFVMAMAPYIDSPLRRRACAEASREAVTSAFDAASLRDSWAATLLSLAK